MIIVLIFLAFGYVIYSYYTLIKFRLTLSKLILFIELLFSYIKENLFFLIINELR